MAKNKKSYRRYVVIKGCKRDFGFGPGVIGRDEITYTDENNRGFASPMFLLKRQDDAIELILGHVTCLYDSPPGRKWNKDPQATYRAEQKRRKKRHG